MSARYQIKDDDDLLETMMNDYLNVDKDYQADDFWRNYEMGMFKGLKKYGLMDFLSKPNSFGSCYTRRNIFPLKFAAVINAVINKLQIVRLFRKFGLKSSYVNAYGWNREDPNKIRETYGNFIFGLINAMPNGDRLYGIEDDLMGNPSEKIKASNNGRFYSMSFLNYFFRAILMDKYLDLSAANLFFEIGGGYGGQAEVLLKLFPNLKIGLVEIPPQLYVMEQYLKSLFPNDVLGYRETRNFKRISRETFKNKRIAIFAPWDIPKIENDSFECFTNQASFQEMSPETVKRYCDELNRVVAEKICLFEQREGCGGVKIPVTKQDYEDYLTAFEMVADKNLSTGGHLGGDENRPISHEDFYVFQKKKVGISK